MALGFDAVAQLGRAYSGPANPVTCLKFHILKADPQIIHCEYELL